MRSIVRVCGELLLTAGVIGLLFLGYLVWGTAARTAGYQRQFAAELNNEWAHAQHLTQPRGFAIPPDPIHLVSWQPFGFIRIPAFGPNWRFTLIEGTALPQLDVSPGHVPGTQLPGQIGNFAVAGHRVTAGNPFWSLPSLHAGDLVYIDTEYNTYTYRVIGKPQRVSPADTGILDPVPNHPSEKPTKRLITLITCDPAWTGTHRIIVTGVLIAAAPRESH
jgi:sortase A